MKEFNKLLIILLCTSLLLSIFVGCGSSNADSEPAHADSTAVSAAEVSSDESAPAEELETPLTVGETVSEETVPEEEPETPSSVEETVPEEPEIDAEPVELDILMAQPPMLPCPYEEMGAIVTGMEKTNVIAHIVSLDQDSYGEKLSISMAAGDMADIVAGPEMYYSGGIEALIEDEICIDLAPYFDTLLSDFNKNLYSTDADYAAAITSDTGKVVSIATLECEYSGGTVIRKDLLDQLGMDVPETYDQLDEVLYAFKDTFGLQNTVLLTNTFTTDGGFLCGGLGAYTYYMNGSTDIPWQIDDNGKAVASINTEGYKDWITMLNRWWEDGILGSDCLSVRNSMEQNNIIYRGDVGFWVGRRDTFGQAAMELAVEGFDAIPIKDITKTGTETVPYGFAGRTASNNGFAVTTSCETPEAAIRFINWFFSDDGIIATNYGEEGYTFEYDEDHNPVFTDVINNNPDYTAQMAVFIYLCFHDWPSYYVPEGVSMIFTVQKDFDSQEVWPSNHSNEKKYYGTLTIAEAQSYSEMIGDIHTYITETTSSFIVGDKDLSEWDAFIARLDELGLGQITEMKQAAYDRYIARVA